MFKRSIISLLFVIIGAEFCLADDLETIIGRFRAYDNTGTKIEGTRGVWTEAGLEGIQNGKGPISIPRNEIISLERHRGTKAGTGVLVGAGGGLAIAILAYASAKAEAADDPYMEVDESKIGPIILGFTLGGGLIGLVIGSSMQLWEQVPLNINRIGLKVDPEGQKLLLTMSF